ncbi:Mut7-C RNAse domain-containing protein [Prolixibacter sp. SD074]|jgi:hypothetical protein|uniref:Mut7-C RNAse domain-containing protein n=1 Tax=Prolixibacter sp. SD074 TaxID=2652391 RepID=UPI00126B6339|nr:Mut7-C RNAse domain-containing protein [Prolixibacter sp. SD074]GET28716.1 hypothetical protein SD074_09180 [Prolixibacter sp. SD074]
MKKLSFIWIRAFGNLNDFLSSDYRQKPFRVKLRLGQTVKDAVESVGIPHVEIDVLTINGHSVRFEAPLSSGDLVNVYPAAKLLDDTSIIHLRPVLSEEIRFILDVHLGKLAKYLRMLGFDTMYRNQMDDDVIANIAEAENRIVLTRDLGILKYKRVLYGYWLRSQHSKKQLSEVINHFDLFRAIRPFTRCMHCNGHLKEVPKGEVAKELETGTRRYYDQFYRCTNCGKIFWEGSHFAHMNLFIDEFLDKMNPKDSDVWNT